MRAQETDLEAASTLEGLATMGGGVGNTLLWFKTSTGETGYRCSAVCHLGRYCRGSARKLEASSVEAAHGVLHGRTCRKGPEKAKDLAAAIIHGSDSGHRRLPDW